MPYTMPSEAADNFARDGVIIIKNFYDVERDIRPVQDGIQAIIRAFADKENITVPCETPQEALQKGYAALIAHNRSWGGHIYDAVKQIPAFMRLVSHEQNEKVFARLRQNSLPGLAAGGYGIRIDNPSEDKFRAPWHQEFPAQLRSPDGIVFWSPLLTITEDMGPVEIAKGSYKEGMIPVYEDDGGIGKSGAYALRLDREQERLANYETIAPCTEPGDLVLMDFLTMHQSGLNRSDRPRWSMQFRYFNFANPVGQSINWKGSYAAGERFGDLFPDLVARRPDAA
jgi:ectoine hydroxylase-related dioxygenase (phytanoyl-CoA dioxygenase family)